MLDKYHYQESVWAGKKNIFYRRRFNKIAWKLAKYKSVDIKEDIGRWPKSTHNALGFWAPFLSHSIFSSFFLWYILFN